MSNPHGLKRTTLAFFERFAKEDAATRREIASMLPTYNELLNMRARSFSEFALQIAVEQQGLNYCDPLFDYATVRPPCPKCHSTKTIRKSTERYQCPSCGTFTAHWNSISSGAKTSSLTWMKVLRCMLDFYNIKRTCDACNISYMTYYNIRNRLFYAMEIALRKIKLYGKVQCDNTFIYANYRGINLSEDEYPDDSPMDIINFKPRSAHRRGHANSHGDSGWNSVCIFTAIDEFGHVLTSFVGIGAATSSLLVQAVKDRILPMVPEDVTVSELADTKEEPSKSGEPSLLISDREASIARFAKRYGISHESHVFRRDGKQVSLAEDAHDIQRVNALHQRLKLFLLKTNYVSTKYLPGFLTFFEWLENTRATEEAIKALFRIASIPGLGPPANFYKERFIVPNYLAQWCAEDNPLRKFPYNKLLGYYLYRQRLLDIQSGKNTRIMPMDEIVFLTGYREGTIRRNYKNMTSAGMAPLIAKYFQPPEELPKTRAPKRKQHKPIPQEDLAMFDEYQVNLTLPISSRLSMENFTVAMNEKYGTSFTANQLRYRFLKVVKQGVRNPLSTYANRIKSGEMPVDWEIRSKTEQTYRDLKEQYRKQGQKPPRDDKLVIMVAQQLSLSEKEVHNHLEYCHRTRKRFYGTQNGEH